MHLSHSKTFHTVLCDIFTNKFRQHGLQMEDGIKQEQNIIKIKVRQQWIAFSIVKILQSYAYLFHYQSVFSLTASVTEQKICLENPRRALSVGRCQHVRRCEWNSDVLMLKIQMVSEDK